MCGMPPRKSAMTPDQLRARIDASGLSVSAFARLLGVDRGTVHRWLSGMHAIDSGSAALIREKLKNYPR